MEFTYVVRVSPSHQEFVRAPSWEYKTRISAARLRVFCYLGLWVSCFCLLVRHIDGACALLQGLAATAFC